MKKEELRRRNVSSTYYLSKSVGKKMMSTIHEPTAHKGA